MKAQNYALVMNETGLDIWPAIILERLIYWHSRARATLDGVPYVVRTFEEWNHEVGISARCYKRAIQILREQGFVSTEIHPHPFKTGVLRATWVRLSDASIDLARTLRKVQKGPVETSVTAHSSYTTESITGEDQSAAPSEPEKPQECLDVGKLNEPKPAKTMADIQAMMKQPEKINSKKIATGADLECYWKAGLSKHHEGHFFGSFTRAHRAFAKKLVEKIPKDEIANVIDRVLSDWEGFRQWVRKNSTTFKIAEHPDLLTVLKFSDHAVNFARGGGPAINCNKTKPVADDPLGW